MLYNHIAMFLTTMKKKLLALACGAAACTASLAVPAEVGGFLSDFLREMKAVDANYSAATNRLPRQYASDLAALQKRYQSEGLLDELLAVKKELSRFQTAIAGEGDPFEDIPEMTEDVLVESPEPLRALQDRYISSRRDIAGRKKSEEDVASEKLLKRLDTVKRDLTRRGKIDEAMEIRAVEERVKTAIEDGTVLARAEAIAGKAEPQPAAEPAPATAAPGDSPDASEAQQPAERKRPANWSKWAYVGERAFSPDLRGLFNPDLHSPVSLRVLEKTGFITFAAERGLQPQQVGGALCDWSGQAVEWTVSDVANLPVDIKINAKHLAPDMKHGPRLFIYVLGGEPAVARMEVELMQQECLVRILRDTTDPTRFAIFWPKAGRSRPFTMKEGARARVIIGAALSGIREKCDTAVQFE